jgi:hypothetical protein
MIISTASLRQAGFEMTDTPPEPCLAPPCADPASCRAYEYCRDRNKHDTRAPTFVLIDARRAAAWLRKREGEG